MTKTGTAFLVEVMSESRPGTAASSVGGSTWRSQSSMASSRVPSTNRSRKSGKSDRIQRFSELNNVKRELEKALRQVNSGLGV